MLTATRTDKKTFAAQEALAASLAEGGAGPEDVEVEAGAHPEGRKRGGTVLVHVDEDDESIRVFYDEVAEEWYAYDEEPST